MSKMTTLDTLRKSNQSDILRLPKSKVCKNCKQEKPRDEYKREMCNADGRDNVCKKCRAAKQKELRDNRKKRDQEYNPFFQF